MANLELHMKKGDTRPAFRAQLIDEPPGGIVTVVDLTLATSARLMLEKPDATLVNELLTIEVPTTAGWVSRPWNAPDINQLGDYRFEVQITWNDGGVQTFPADTYGLLSVIEDLD